MGGFLGTLSSLPATKLGSIVIECALKRAHGHANLVQEVFFGNVLSANLGQAALGAGIPNSVVCTTINKVCSSGMKAMHAAQSIQLGINDVVVAGGMESMCNAPKYLAETRKGSRLGHDMVIDGMLKDGLWDVYNDYAMGMCAELCADQHTITRGADPIPLSSAKQYNQLPTFFQSLVDEVTPISKVLYLGAASGTIVSHVSDIVGPGTLSHQTTGPEASLNLREEESS
ncbi:hypothetical protein MRB53_023211 [Persea americana]|uniref:Uncharacterized protein n=1 Tax=Persea americana TaxID=3435 RepID=A0ACC2L9A9_PERAE|nr:hypothetical protein MRB53_023211 [Persea americana]